MEMARVEFRRLAEFVSAGIVSSPGIRRHMGMESWKSLVRVSLHDTVTLNRFAAIQLFAKITEITLSLYV